MTITATTRVGRDGREVCYEGTREDLIACGLVTPDMFPKPRQKQLSKFQGYPVGKAKNGAGRFEWGVSREKGGRYSVTYSNEYLEMHTEMA